MQLLNALINLTKGKRKMLLQGLFGLLIVLIQGFNDSLELACEGLLQFSILITDNLLVIAQILHHKVNLSCLHQHLLFVSHIKVQQFRFSLLYCQKTVTSRIVRLRTFPTHQATVSLITTVHTEIFINLIMVQTSYFHQHLIIVGDTLNRSSSSEMLAVFASFIQGLLPRSVGDLRFKGDELIGDKVLLIFQSLLRSQYEMSQIIEDSLLGTSGTDYLIFELKLSIQVWQYDMGSLVTIFCAQWQQG